MAAGVHFLTVSCLKRAGFLMVAAAVLYFLPPGDSQAQIYDFKTYTVREGLLSDDVTALCQDSYGYLWVGSGDGISVYDGETFKKYSILDGLASSLVNCITEDVNRKGVMWIGTNGGGASLFRVGKFKTFRMGRSEWSNRINSIAQDRNGTVYLATDDGVYEIQDDTTRPLSAQFAHGGYEQVACSRNNLIIVAANGNMFRYSLTGRDTGGSAVEAEMVNMVGFDPGGDLWSVSYNGDVTNLSTGLRFPHAIRAVPRTMLWDSAGDFWVVTSDGLYLLRSSAGNVSKPVRITAANGLGQNDLTCGVIDKEDELWVGMAARGLAKLPDRNSVRIPVNASEISINNSQASSDRHGHIWVVAEDGIEEVWFGGSGLLHKRKHLYSSLGIKSTCTTSQVDAEGRLWLASKGGRVFSFSIANKGRRSEALRLIRSYSPGQLLPGKDVLCLYIDRESRAWYSRNMAGVLEFDTGIGLSSCRVYTEDDGLPDNSVRAIYEDDRGNMWFGGYIGGLSELKAGSHSNTMTRFTAADGLPENSVRSIVQDDEGRLWVGTRYGGAAIRTEHGFSGFSVKEGLVSNCVWAMSSDSEYGIFFATQLGMQCLARGAAGPRRWMRYGEIRPYYACGVIRSASGRSFLWACDETGILVVDLDAETQVRTCPPVYITGLLVNGRDTRVGSGHGKSGHRLELDHSRNTITFEFTGISLRDENRLRYNYILRGADANWHELSQRLPVTYATLKPGKYKFEVQAVNSMGIRSREPAELAFEIVPPYWRRWWFALSVGLMTVLLAYWAIKTSFQRVIEIERVRSRIATDLHDDIGSGLTRIAILADVAMRQSVDPRGTGVPGHTQDPEEDFSTRNLMKRIGTNARELVDSMSDVVWSIDPKNAAVGDLIMRIRSFAYEMCEAKGIALEFDIEAEIGALHPNPGVIRTMLLIIKEAVNNSVRHSNCRRVRITMKRAPKRIILGVSDDGSGISGKTTRGGHGLESMRQRATKIGGEFKVRSQPGEGTSIEASIPANA